MTKKTLYRVGSTVTPIEQETYDSILYRLIADEGKELVKGDVRTPCIDVEAEDADGWAEEEAEDDHGDADELPEEMNDGR